MDKVSDLIDRQAAIDAIKNQTCLTYEEIFNRCLVSIKDENGWVGGIKDAIEALIDLPSAQPETHGKRTETHACDCISREAAIDAVFKDDRNTTIKQRLEALPSAQPEIITCTECKYYDTDTEQCNNDKGLRFIDFSNPERMWCPWAERREE